jgi:hypothetical protein
MVLLQARPRASPLSRARTLQNFGGADAASEAGPDARRLARRAGGDRRTIQQNLWFTAGYNVVGIVLATTGWLPPILAAAAQALPDVAVMLSGSAC